jgi:hypothetical protein
VLQLRRHRVPDVVTAVSLPPRERRLAWALTVDGQPVVATGESLLLPDGTVLPWGQVEKAVWQAPLLTVRESADVEGTGALHQVRLDEERDLPAVVYARVTASVAWSRHERLSPSGGVRLVGRRQSGRDQLDWQLVYDAGTDVGDPLIREQAQRMLLEAQRTIG